VPELDHKVRFAFIVAAAAEATPEAGFQRDGSQEVASGKRIPWLPQSHRRAKVLILQVFENDSSDW